MELELRPQDRIILPLDFDNPQKATAIVEQLKDHVGPFKVGLQTIWETLAGLLAVDDYEAAVANLRIARRLFNLIGDRLFLDGKFDDIPNTVAGASVGAVKFKPWMFNLHASIDVDGMMDAVAKRQNSLVFAVTVLTSCGEDICHLIYGDPPRSKVLQFARNAKLAGVNGLICSPLEIELLRSRRELQGMMLATPGVRPAWASTDDQSRIGTPEGAMEAGADFIVIGRPITSPPPGIGTPVDAAKKVAEEIAVGLAQRAEKLKGGAKK